MVTKAATFTIEIETLKKLSQLADKLDYTKSKIVNMLLLQLLHETDSTKVENLISNAIKELKSDS